MKIVWMLICLITAGLLACRRGPPQKIPARDLYDEQFEELVRLGEQIFHETPVYIGPRGSRVQQPANEISCRNCHLDGGVRRYGLPVNTSLIRYPDYAVRFGKIVDLADRINLCFERPMNSLSIPPRGPEMLALTAYLRHLYIEFIRSGQKLGMDSKLLPISFPDRAADPKKGQQLYATLCLRCHQADGGGVRFGFKPGFKYPPLWGSNSFEETSSIGTIITLARFLKGNMPFGVTPDDPLLSDEQAFDIAAYLLAPDKLRPKKGGVKRWTNPHVNLKQKSIDNPNGPYLDPFPDIQHRLGPFGPIVDWYKNQGLQPRFQLMDLKTGFTPPAAKRPWWRYKGLLHGYW